jgi:signal transduction histidine kinase
MIEGSYVDGIDRAALQTFMKRVRATLGHDLRTPLGTIVNYASVLEEDSGLDEEELRDLPRRIRGLAMQTAEMLQLLLDATLLAASAPAFAPVDPNALLQSIVDDIENALSPRKLAPPPANAANDPDLPEIEPEIVAFAWRAFLQIEKSLSLRPLSAARATVERRADRVRLGVTFHSKAENGAAPVDLDAFARGGEVEVPVTNRFALRLSRDLVTARGGELELFGRIGADAAICMSFPQLT